MLPVNGALVFNAQPVGRACKLRESRENKQCEPGAVCHATWLCWLSCTPSIMSISPFCNQHKYKVWHCKKHVPYSRPTSSNRPKSRPDTCSMSCSLKYGLKKTVERTTTPWSTIQVQDEQPGRISRHTLNADTKDVIIASWKAMNEPPLPVTKSTLLQLCEVVCFHYDGAVIFKVDELAVKRCVSVDETAWGMIFQTGINRKLRGTDFTCPLKHTKWINDDSIKNNAKEKTYFVGSVLLKNFHRLENQ